MTFLTSEQRAKGSLNPEYASMCGGKFIHYNFLTAMQHAKSLEKDDKAAGRPKQVSIYHCEFCGAEHIGHLNSCTFRFPFPSPEDEARIERDKQITKILHSGAAVARQGNPSVLFTNKSS